MHGRRSIELVVAGACLVLFATSATAQTRAYVSGVAPDTGCSIASFPCTRGFITVVNTATNRVETTIALWRNDAIRVQDVLVTPNGQQLYVILDVPGFSHPGPAPGFTSVQVFDTRTLVHLSTFDFDAHVSECTWAPDGRRLFCARNVLASDVVVIDVATHTVSTTIGANFPHSIAISPDGGRLYVGQGGNAVTVHDGTTYTLIATIPVSAQLGFINISPDGSHLYAALGCRSVVDIETATNTVAAVIPGVAQGSECVHDIAFARGRAYATVGGDTGFHSGFTVIDTATRAIVQRIASNFDFLGEIAATADESRLVATYDFGVRIIDTARNQIVGSPVIPGGPGALAVSPPPAGASLLIDVPANGQTVQQPFTFGGWAVDVFGFTAGPGIAAVHVWAFPDGGGAPTFVGAPEYGRPRPDVAALFGSTYLNAGYQMTVRGLRPGAYTLTAFGLSTRTGTFSVAQRVRVTIASSSRLMIDTPSPRSVVSPSFLVAGWALDGAALTGTGVDAVHVWAYPSSGAPPIFAGAATLGVSRPDVGAAFGSAFANAGYALTVQRLPAGSYMLVVYARQALSGTFTAQQSVTVTVSAPRPEMFLDVPAANATVGSSVRVAGWAIEVGAATGTGVDAVHVWAYPSSGAPPVFVGAAAYGAPRPDVGAIFGSRYTPSGFDVTGSLAPGTYTIVAFAHSTTTNTFNGVRLVRVSVE